MKSEIFEHNFYAMGSQMTAWLALDDGFHKAGVSQAGFAQEKLHQAASLFKSEERRLSRFLETSELSRLNARPERWLPLSDVMWDVVTAALRLAEETGGLFDPTLLGALEAAGYRSSFEQIGNQPGIRDGSSTGRFEEVQLDLDRRAIWLPEGVRLDLGGIGKGYTARRAVQILGRWGPCLIDAGGDLTAGDPPAGDPGWPVGIAAPWTGDPNREDLLRLWLANGSLATSGVDYRRWQQNGRPQHHIIDPATGFPAETDLLSVSVLAGDAAAAEAWATAALVAGKDSAYKIFAQLGREAIFVQKNNRLTLTPGLRRRIQKDLRWLVQAEGLSLYHS